MFAIRLDLQHVKLAGCPGDGIGAIDFRRKHGLPELPTAETVLAGAWEDQEDLIRKYPTNYSNADGDLVLRAVTPRGEGVEISDGLSGTSEVLTTAIATDVRYGDWILSPREIPPELAKPFLCGQAAPQDFAAILDYFLEIAKDIKEKKAAERAEKEEAERRRAEEWAALPLGSRTSPEGVCYCAKLDGEAYVPGSPLAPSGRTVYSPDLLKKYVPAAWDEAGKEVDRLREVRLAEEEAAEQAGRDQLKAWALEHGDETVRLRIEEGFDSWIGLAGDQYAKAIAQQIAERAGMVVLEEDGDALLEGCGKHEAVDRIAPTSIEILALRRIREHLPEGVRVKLMWVRYSGGELGGPVGRPEFKLIIPVPGVRACEEEWLMLPGSSTQNPQPTVKTKYVTAVVVKDPDTSLDVELEIRKLEGGGMVGLDGSWLSNDEGPTFSPYDEGVELDISDDEMK
jgi:hypothetical protein